MPIRLFALNRAWEYPPISASPVCGPRLGLTLTGLLFALGLGAEIGQILAMAG
jgi:hypothetical protein